MTSVKAIANCNNNIRGSILTSRRSVIEKFQRIRGPESD